MHDNNTVEPNIFANFFQFVLANVKHTVQCMLSMDLPSQTSRSDRFLTLRFPDKMFLIICVHAFISYEQVEL